MYWKLTADRPESPKMTALDSSLGAAGLGQTLVSRLTLVSGPCDLLRVMKWRPLIARCTRRYEDLSDGTGPTLRFCVAFISLCNEGKHCQVGQGIYRAQARSHRYPIGPGSRRSALRHDGADQLRLAPAICPVPMMPCRSSMTFRSWGLVAVFIASARLIVSLLMRVTSDWSKVLMP